MAKKKTSTNKATRKRRPANHKEAIAAVEATTAVEEKGDPDIDDQADAAELPEADSELGNSVADLSKPNEAAKVAMEQAGIEPIEPLPEPNISKEDEIDAQDSDTYKAAFSAVVNSQGREMNASERSAMKERAEFLKLHPTRTRSDEPRGQLDKPVLDTLAEQPYQVKPKKKQVKLVDRPWVNLSDFPEESPLSLESIKRAAAAQGFLDNLEIQEKDGVKRFRAKPEADEIPIYQLLRHACLIQGIEVPEDRDQQPVEEVAARGPEDGFAAFTKYNGLLYEEPGISVYGFENASKEHSQRRLCAIPRIGAAFGFVGSGRVRIKSDCFPDKVVNAREYFCLPDGGLVELLELGSRVLIVSVEGFLGMGNVGGPIESAGRLPYIDGCSDSVLIAPPVVGDPVLNLLHFPPEIEQTFHTHPSLRAGFVARGQGVCEHYEDDGHKESDPENPLREPLKIGSLFVIPAEAWHRFMTENLRMDVVAFHPDSDQGPSREDHPMFNRTLVNGEKLDHKDPKHDAIELVSGKLEAKKGS